MPAEELQHRGRAIPEAVRELLRGIVDYAGLFPPAGLQMETAVANYAAYRRGEDAWALGRFVVHASRLEELASAIALVDDPAASQEWRLSALVGPDLREDLERVRAFNHHAKTSRRDILVDVLELKGASEEEIRTSVATLPSGFTWYVEIPLEGQDPEALLRTIHEADGRAKVRTGGTNATMFPGPEALLRFLRACVDLDIPFKATAGLHHPVSGLHPLTDEPGSPRATMYGYLNLLFATVLTRRRAPRDLVLAALRESDPDAFRLHPEGVAWRQHVSGNDEVLAMRERSFVAFGSCSFTQPMKELPFNFPADPSSANRSLTP